MYQFLFQHPTAPNQQEQEEEGGTGDGHNNIIMHAKCEGD